MYQPTTIASPAAIAAAESQPSTSPASPRAGRPKPRKFSESYKKRIVAEYGLAVGAEKGAILRREGLYSSIVYRWSAAINSDTPQKESKRGRPALTQEEIKIRELEKEVATLKSKVETQKKALTNANEVIEILGKGVAFLEALSKTKNAE